ncbi:MAG: hypothetical protein K2Y18_06230 [Alphaproteobacteria bacterium]|jgi:hypothetical protein|nr:hypothetical protein [Alphaproteobacteria bacterium]
MMMKKIQMIQVMFVSLGILFLTTIEGKAAQSFKLDPEMVLKAAKLKQQREESKRAALERKKQKEDEDKERVRLQDQELTRRATTFLQGNFWGRSMLKTPTEPLKAKDIIDFAKYLTHLKWPYHPITAFTQEDLEAMIHLRTNPGNVWNDGPFLTPTLDEIEGAKALRARVPHFTKEELFQEWQNQVSQRVTPHLRQLAMDAKRLSVIHYDPVPGQLKDKEANRLILELPERVRQRFQREYQEAKDQAPIRPEDIEEALIERRRLAAEIFG